jgi:hypothetical protein
LCRWGSTNIKPADSRYDRGTSGGQVNSNRGAVELPDTPGRYVAAEFRDPLFETKPNPYIAAMDSGDLIEVTAVPSLRAGELNKLYIMALAGKAGA